MSSFEVGNRFEFFIEYMCINFLFFLVHQTVHNNQNSMITIYLLQYLTSDLINKIKQLGAKFCCLHMQLELIFFFKNF